LAFSSARRFSSNILAFGLSAQEQGTIHLDDHPVKSEEYQNAVFYLGHLSALSAELSCLENLKSSNKRL
jgi:heme exporter protein A